MSCVLLLRFNSYFPFHRPWENEAVMENEIVMENLDSKFQLMFFYFLYSVFVLILNKVENVEAVTG